jgi:TolB-like protein/cytochrome c-type biogenesis protein CcmH/NrfG/predicted Ser/Thr protein kinase
VAADEPLLDVAVALADGKEVDWESAAQSITDIEDRRLLDELRFIASVARRIPDDSSASVPAAALERSSTPPAALSPTGSPGDSWGPLEVIEHVGRGTFGDVYRAWDSRLDREVALKILRRNETHDHASTVIEEGRLLARVRHPNVVTVYGAERVNGQVGVWMEFVHGKTLEEELRDHGPFDVARVIRIGIELSEALSTVHRVGLIHRDVKAENVLCVRDGRLVLTDFGAGCELQKETDEQTRELAGTPVCVAPEVLAGQAATPQSDVYSLGVLLYHLLTGTYPVLGQSLKELREAHARGARTPLSAARPDLPGAFVQVVDRAFSPNPGDRYDSPDTLGSALSSLVPPGVDEGATRAIGFRRRWRLIAIGVVLAVAAGFAAAPLWWTSETPTIAVLPFKNLSAEPNSEYFVDGLTDEIIRNLSVIEGLDVRSRTSSFTFKDKPPDVRDVGRQLQANFIVEGSVLRSDGRLRINAQLVRVADNTLLWSNRFDRELKDIFAIQDEISRSIVNELRLKLGRGQRLYNTNLEAYDMYLRARALVRHVGPQENRAAAELFNQVTAKDPAFAPAYAGLADAWAAISGNRADGAVRPDEAFAFMKPAAERALQLDPLLAEAHAAMGVVLARDRKWADAEAAFRRATELNGNLSSIPMNFVTSTLLPQGKVDQSVKVLRAALRRDPLSVDVQARLAYVLVCAGRYEESIEIGRRLVPSAAAANDGLNHARQVLARALFQHGERAEAVWRFEQLGSGSDNFRGYAYAAMGRHAEARALAAQRQDFPASLVLIHAGLGEKDSAFEALERMAAEKDPRVGIYLTHPELASLRADPRMGAFRKKLGLPD